MTAAHHTSPPEGIEATGLVKDYPGDIRALDGVSLSVQPGSIFGLLGPNGAGKSTTVRILSTLSKPTAGTATVAGHDVLRNPDRVRRAIGVVGQRSAVDPAATGRENLVLQGQHVRHRGARAAHPHRRDVRALQPHRRRGPAGRHVVGRHAPQARRGDGPHQPPAGAVPRRADHRSRSGGPRGAVVRGGRAVTRERPRDPADHPLPRGGRPPRRPPRHRRPREDRRRRHAGGPEGRAARRRDPHRPRRTRRRPGRRDRSCRGSRASRPPSSTAPGSPPAPTTPRPACPPSCRRSTSPASPSRRSPSPARRSTTSTSATPAGRSARRPWRSPDDRPHPDHVPVRAPPAGLRPPAVVRRHRDHAAGDLAAAVRRPVPERRPRSRASARRAAATSTTSSPACS